MKYEPYIKAGKEGKNFYYVFSLLNYEELPIVFVARDDRCQVYLCDCTEFRFGKQRWTIAKTTPSVIRDIINHHISVYSSLSAFSDTVILAECDLKTDQYNQTIMQINKVPENLLPAKDSVLSCICEDAIENLSQFEAEYCARAAKPVSISPGCFDGAFSFLDIMISKRVRIPRECIEDKLSIPNIEYNNNSDSFKPSFERDEAA